MSTHTVTQQEVDARTNIGFWLYLMTDCVLFASLFAVYAVLHGAVAAGPSSHDIFNSSTALIETLILLTSSFTCGLAYLAVRHKNIKQLIAWLVVTYVLGVSFLTIELTEFHSLIAEGRSWQQSAFLSAFFTLVGTHGLHITIGLLWLIVLVAVLAKRGLTQKLSRQFMLFAMFWHFLDLVWIFIFTVVYMLGIA